MPNDEKLRVETEEEKEWFDRIEQRCRESRERVHMGDGKPVTDILLRLLRGKPLQDNGEKT